jgi:hypothetical protein
MAKSTFIPPGLGQPGSGFEISLEPSVGEFTDVLVAQECQLLLRKEEPFRLQVVGDDSLVSANFRNLSAKLTTEGIAVKAWSFFSGNLPGAEMIYEAKQEPEDVIAMTEFSSITELLPQRKRQLRDHNLLTRPYGPSQPEQTDQTAVKKAGLNEVYIIDDWAAFVREMASREVLFTDEELTEAYETVYGVHPAFDYSIALFVGSKVPSKTKARFNIFMLESYEGLRPRRIPSNSL